MTASSKPTVTGLLEFYEKILQSLGLDVDEQGLISMDLGGTKMPVTIGEKRLVLPTPVVLREGNWDHHVAFHPLAENIYRGESPVLKKLKALVNFRLTAVISCLITELTEIAADKSYHEKLSPQQSELLSHLPKATDKTVDTFGKIINAVSPTGKNRLVNIYLKRGGKFKGEDYSRLAVTNFPVREGFGSEELALFGVKFTSKKDQKAFESLFDYLLPGSDNNDTYSHGSRSMEAPYFDALMHAYVKVATHLNKTTWLFRKHLDNHQGLMMDHHWEDKLKDLAFFRDLIPSLTGNDGEVSIDEAQRAKYEEKVQEEVAATGGSIFAKPTKTTTTTTATSALDRLASDVIPPAKVAAVPEQAAPRQEATAESEGGLSWNEVMAKRQQLQTPQHAPAFAWQQPQMMMAPPPGWGGTPVMQAPVNPGTYAAHPRNAPQPQYPWQQTYQQPQQQWGGGQGQGVVYPTGI